MHVKNILAAFIVAGLATATPVGDIEERADCDPKKAWCCTSAVSPLNIFFIRGVGSDCTQASSGTCSGGKKFLCCSTNQITVIFFKFPSTAEMEVANRE